MIIYFIRHGEPDYEHDTLTEKGRLQAEKLIKRLSVSGLDHIYTSPMGRAKATAAPAERYFNLTAEVLPWAYEIGRETFTEYPDGNPKKISAVSPLYWMAPDARQRSMDEFFHRDGVSEGFKQRYEMIARGVDDLILSHGYARTPEGFYKAVRPNKDHIALFCHNAMMRAVISHLFNIPYQFLNCTLLGNHTGITAVDLENEPEGTILTPRLLSYGDIGHLYETGEPAEVNYDTHEAY